MTLALSIRQPWAWAIINAGKDIENRSWSTKVRGRVLIHASATLPYREYADFYNAIRDPENPLCDATMCSGGLPAYEALQRGGVVGEAEIVDCVDRSASPWFFGPFGFLLRNARPLPFRPLKGRLGFFEVRE